MDNRQKDRWMDEQTDRHMVGQTEGQLVWTNGQKNRLSDIRLALSDVVVVYIPRTDRWTDQQTDR